MARFGSAAVLIASFVALPAAAPAIAQTAPSVGDRGSFQEAQNATTVQGQHSDNLSSQLSKSGGVITPQADVDPGMHVPAPDPHPNSTPVIPPSATGGSSAK